MNSFMITGSTCLMMLAVATSLYADDSSNDAPIELQVAPLDQIEYPDDRPRWVADAKRDGMDMHLGTVHFLDESTVVVVSQLCDTPDECRDRLSVTQLAAAQEYVSRTAESLGDIDFFTISDEEIEELIDRHLTAPSIRRDRFSSSSNGVAGE